MTDRNGSRWVAWLGWGLERLGIVAIATWAGLTAGWIALSLVHRSGGWLFFLSLMFGLYLVLPGGLVLLGGRLLRRGRDFEPPYRAAVAARVAWVLFAAAGAAFAYLAGWPR